MEKIHTSGICLEQEEYEEGVVNIAVPIYKYTGRPIAAICVSIPVQRAHEELLNKMTEKLKKSQFDFEDYLESMKQMRKMGGLGSIMNMLPGLGGMGGLGKGKMPDIDADDAEQKMARVEAIIYSMTIKERQNPDIITPQRKRRIAAGAGVDISEVNKMMKQF